MVLLRVLALAALASLLATSCQESSARAPAIDLFGGAEIDSTVETRQLLFGTGDRSHLLDGWSVDEHGGELDLFFVWATALESSLALDVLDVEDKQFLLKLSAYPTRDPQEITVLVNGHEVTRFTAAPIFLEYRFVVSAKWLQRGRNRVVFRHSALATRSDGLEDRQFAAAYNWLLIGPQCLPLRGFGLPPPPSVERSETEPARLVVTGPAELKRRLTVPRDAVFQARMRLPGDAHGAARSVIRLVEGDRVTDLLETRLSPSLWGRERSRDLKIDLSPWSGKAVELRVEVRPEACRSPIATVIIEQAGIYSGGAG